MNKNRVLAALLVVVSALVVAVTGRAQVPPMPAPVFTGGLLGEDYAGIEAAYVHHRENGPPGVLHRYGFLANRPLPDGRDLDGIFRYNYTSGTKLGPDGSQHDVAIGLAGYRRNGAVAPLLEGQIGWAWAKAGSLRANSFLYVIRAGAEIMVSPRASLTPSITFVEARRFHDEDWQFGVKGAFRPNRDLGLTLSLHIDDEHNVETALGAHRRF